MGDHDLSATFQVLRGVLAPLEPRLVKVHDESDHYYLDTAHIQKNRKPLFFGAVRTGRRYVSYYLMPVYIWPELLDGISERLRSRMQGKSCFNFTSPDPALVKEIATLTQHCIARCSDAGYVPPS